MSTIKQYSKTEAAIAELAARYNQVPDVTTDAGLKACKKDYREIRKYEIDLDKMRKELGAEARKHLDNINSEAKRITEQLQEISGPYKEAFEAREAELKAAEEARINGIKARIQQMNGFVTEAHGLDSTGVSNIIQAVELIDCAEGFDELTADALGTQKKVMAELGTILQQKLAAEAAERQQAELDEMRRQMEAERAELERQRRELEAAKQADDDAHPITDDLEPAPRFQVPTGRTQQPAFQERAHGIQITDDFQVELLAQLIGDNAHALRHDASGNTYELALQVKRVRITSSKAA